MTAKPEVDRRWVEALPDHAIDEILDVMHDMLGRGLRRDLRLEIFRRRGRPLTAWPEDKGSAMLGVPAKVRVALICRDALTERDSKHRPTLEVDGKVLCSCGAIVNDSGRLYRVSSEWWWPRVMREGIPHYIFCRYGQCVDDPDHAPIAAVMENRDHYALRCICSIGTGFQSSKEYHPFQAQVLPVY